MPAKRKIDWDAVEPYYRAGILSLQEIAHAFGCSRGRIVQVAEERKWERDLTAKIKAKAKAKLNKTILNTEPKHMLAYSEAAVIEANSDRIVAIELTHRKYLTRARELSMTFMEELEELTVNRVGYHDLAEQLSEESEQKLRESINRVSSIPGRVDMLKKLAESMRIFVTMERDVYGIREGNIGDTLESLLQKIDG